MTSLCFKLPATTGNLIVAQGVLLSWASVKPLLNPQHSWGFSSTISCWINNDSTVVQQAAETNTDTLVQLSKLYKDGLLTKQEFETKKKQLLGSKNEQ